MAKGFSTTPDPENRVGARVPKNRSKLKGPGDSNLGSKKTPVFSPKKGGMGGMGRKGC